MTALKEDFVALEARVAKWEKCESVAATISLLCDVRLTLILPIPMVIQFNGDDYVASFFDANLSASGDTTTEAFDNLRDIIETTFLIYADLPPEKLGQGPARQLAALRQFIGRTN